MNASITNSRLKELVKEVMVEENEYQAFFAKALEKAGKGINDMSEEEKKAFFNKVDSAWNGKGEKNESVNEGDGLWANIRAKQARGEKPANKNSQAHKDAVKAGEKINKEESVVNEGKKVFKVNPQIGKAKYSISSHDGVKKHKDGSDFFDIKIFKNKVDLEKAIKNYTSKGFVKESVKESKSDCGCGCGGITKGGCSTNVVEESAVNESPLSKNEKLAKKYSSADAFAMAVAKRFKSKSDVYKNVDKDKEFMDMWRDMWKSANESVNEGISVFDERFFGKKGIIIMIDDNGKKVSAIFKDKKNADKYNRNNPSDIKKLLDLAKKTKYPNAIDESVNERYTGNSGDKLKHKYDKNIEIELIEPTNKGWKVYQTDKGNKRKIAYFDKQDIVGNKSLFESVNEADVNWNAVQNAIINFLKMNTKILDKRVQEKDLDGVKGGLKSIISGLTNAQRSLKLESVNEDVSAELPKAIIPSAVKQKLELAIDKIKDAKLNPTQKLQLVAQVVDSLGIDKTQLGTIANKIRSKMESKK